MGIVFLGPPGSGKGTQAESLAKEFGLKLIVMGDMLRKEIKTESMLGKKVKSYVEKGALVPDELVIELLKNHLINNGSFILDGFPRTIRQAELLDKTVKIDKVVYFKCPSETILERLSSRRICPECNKVYNLLTNKPKDDEICDDCKAKLLQRKDDEKSVIQKRIEVYNKETLPVVGFYQKKSIIEEIDANNNIKEIYSKLKCLIIVAKTKKQ